MGDDPSLKMKLLQAHFMSSNYEAVVEHGNSLKLEKTFINSEQRVVFAWALHQTGQSGLAEITFADMDKSFSNYYHRLEFCKFLIQTKKVELAKEKLTDLMQEFDHVKGPERRLNRNTFHEIKELYAGLVHG
jgi:hypothetical protein